MPTEPEPAPHPQKKHRRPKPGPEDFVIFEVDGFAQMTPEQRTWPVVPLGAGRPKPATPGETLPPPKADESP